MPEIGDRVFARPRSGLQVQRGEGLYQQYLAQEGQEVLWDDFHARRLQEGAIEIVQQAEPPAEVPPLRPAESPGPHGETEVVSAPLMPRLPRGERGNS